MAKKKSLLKIVTGSFFRDPPNIRNDIIYAAEDNGTLTAVSFNGKELWTHYTIEGLIDTLLFDNEHLFTFTEDYFYKVNKHTGETIWEKKIDCNIGNSFFIDKNNIALICGNMKIIVFDITKRVVRLRLYLEPEEEKEYPDFTYLYFIKDYIANSFTFISIFGVIYNINKNVTEINWKYNTRHNVLFDPI
ncbi:hypothetical protein KKF97_13915, partial [Myxococcota bacterium]|nr:hypothetical protein [Myxococcota bacterium]